MNIQEDYCSKEIYRLLIEKGFDGEVHTTFDKEGYTQPSITLQMAMKWLREVHNIFIAIEIVPHVTVTMEQKYYFFKLYKDRRPCKSPLNDSVRLYSSYEEATEAAIKYSLKNLI